MEQIIKSLNIISTSQEFLKSNYSILNQYWIEPRVKQLPNPTDLNIDIKNTLDQITNHINLIDGELEQIISISIQNQIFVQVLELTTWVDLERLFMNTFVKFNFIFGISPEFTQPISQWIDLDPTIRLEIGLEFISEFKKIFGYKFLNLINREFLENFLQVLSHVKKLYLGHF